MIKLQIPAGKATPAPPVGPALGQHGVNIMDFCKAFNAKTQGQEGLIIPVVISSLKLYKIFNLQNLKARWAAYMLGILIWMFIMNITPFINQLYDPALAMFYFIVSLSIIPANFLIYLGVGKIDKA